MAVLEHFLFNSDYPTDKVVFLQEGTVTPTATWQNFFTYINTHAKTMLYFEGDYKVQGSNGVYPIGTSKSFDNMFVSLASFMYNGECWVTVAAMTLQQSSVGKKISFRLWGYCSDEESKNIDLGMTANAAKPAITLTSDCNYPKFIGECRVTPGQSYSHNLGFAPVVKSWGKFHDSNVPLPDGSTASIDYYMLMGNDGYFGNPATWANPFMGYMIQAGPSIIKTYQGDDSPLELYMRMYQV